MMKQMLKIGLLTTLLVFSSIVVVNADYYVFPGVITRLKTNQFEFYAAAGILHAGYDTYSDLTVDHATAIFTNDPDNVVHVDVKNYREDKYGHAYVSLDKKYLPIVPEGVKVSLTLYGTFEAYGETHTYSVTGVGLAWGRSR